MKVWKVAAKQKKVKEEKKGTANTWRALKSKRKEKTAKKTSMYRDLERDFGRKNKKKKKIPFFLANEWPNTIFLWALLLSHHGVKQCFHTMDVAANYWATAASPSAGPISAKSAIFIKNATIFVAKHTKNLVKNGTWQITWEVHTNSTATIFFFPSTSACLLLQHDSLPELKHTSIASRKLKKKKKDNLAEKIKPVLRLDFLSFGAYYFLPIIMKQ